MIPRFARRSLRETYEAKLQRVQDRSQSEISYLMAQLTEKDSHISKLARKLTVAEVDSDWRRLLSASERVRRVGMGKGDDKDEGGEVKNDAEGRESEERVGDTDHDLDRELEAQRKDIARALRYNPDRSLSPPPERKLASFLDPLQVDTKLNQRENVNIAPPVSQHAPKSQQEDTTVEKAKPKTTLTLSSKTRQQQQQRHFYGSGVGDLLTTTDARQLQQRQKQQRTYGMPSQASNQRRLGNSKRVGLQQPADPSGGVQGAIDNYAKIPQPQPQYKQVSELPPHLRGDGNKVHGVLTSELGARASRANRKYIPPPTVDPDGGFQGVLEGVYATGEAIPNSQRGREGRLGRSRSPPSRRNSPTRSPAAQNGQQSAAVSPSPQVDSSAPAAGVQPPKEFTPFSTKTAGKFSLNRSSAPFATTETVAAVRSTVSAQESSLMKIGMETTLLKAEMDKLARGRKSAAVIRRIKEVDELMLNNDKEMSSLRRSLKEKKEALGLA